MASLPRLGHTDGRRFAHCGAGFAHPRANDPITQQVAESLQERLIIESGPRQGTSVELSRDRACHVGHGSESDLQITGPGVAENHLVIKALKDGGFGVKCLATPFTLNGQPTEAARLKNGDILELGGSRIRFTDSYESEPSAGESPSSIGGFRVVRILGSGGMGTVYEAEQVSLNRHVALKVLNKDLTRDPVFVARFVAEARAAARLHHPNVVQVFDVGHEGDTFFYSMEVMHRGSLEDRLKKLGKLDVDDALSVIADTARGLSYAESLRIVHRDIKPDNLMLDQHGHVKIADLGLALTDEDDVSKVIGTPHFMSPEQALGKPLDHRSDLYSLGCTFYRLLTGRTPFRRDSVKAILRAHVRDAPDSASKVSPEVPAEVSAIVDRLLKKEPANRYQSAEELLGDIEEVLAPPARKGVLMAAIGVAVLVAGGALWWGLTRPEGKTETKIIEKLDPRTAAYAEKLRQSQAQEARMAVLLSGPPRAPSRALIEALEQMASDHPDTRAAETALQEAKRMLSQIEASEARHAAHEQAVATAEQELRQAATKLIDAGDFRGAAAMLQPTALAEDMREEPSLLDALSELLVALERGASTRLDGLKQAVVLAQSSRDPDTLRTALADLEAVLDPAQGWPGIVLPNRDDLAAYTVAGRQALASLTSELTASALTESWSTYRAAMLGPTGVLHGVDTFDPTSAASGARAVAAALAAFEPGRRADALAASLDHAGAFLQRFTEAASSGTLHYAPQNGENGGRTNPVPVVAFAGSGDSMGLTVKFGPVIRPKNELLPLTSLRGPRLPEVFDLPGSGVDPDRVAFLGWVAIVDQISAARAYLSRVSGDLPQSGTGEDGFAGGGAVLSMATEALTGLEEPWARALRHELAAARLTVRALRAFSSRRNLSAANHISQLLESFPHSLVVSALNSP